MWTLKEEMWIDRAKSQSKCRSNEHVLHKDTYHIINMTETQRELQLERIQQKQIVNVAKYLEQESLQIQMLKENALSLNEELIRTCYAQRKLKLL